MDANNRRTSTPASSGGVLRQFRPSISDQWLVSNDSNSKSLHRRSSHHNSVQGVLKDSRRAPRSSRAMNQAGTSSISPNNTHAATATTMATTMIPSLSNNNNNNGTSIRLTCPECLVCVDGIQALESHLHRRHSDNASSPSVLLTCPHCSEGIKHRTNLHRHIRVKHDERTGRHHCRKCGFVCSSESDLERHKQKHRACPFCRVVMESGTGLAKHMQNCRHRNPTRR